MTARITNAELKGALERLNHNTNGTYRLGHDIQGYTLQRLTNADTGAISLVGFPSTKAETYYTIQTINHLIESEKWLVENAPHGGLTYPK